MPDKPQYRLSVHPSVRALLQINSMEFLGEIVIDGVTYGVYTDGTYVVNARKVQ